MEKKSKESRKRKSSPYAKQKSTEYQSEKSNNRSSATRRTKNSDSAVVGVASASRSSSSRERTYSSSSSSNGAAVEPKKRRSSRKLFNNLYKSATVNRRRLSSAAGLTDDTAGETSGGDADNFVGRRGSSSSKTGRSTKPSAVDVGEKSAPSSPQAPSTSASTRKTPAAPSLATAMSASTTPSSSRRPKQKNSSSLGVKTKPRDVIGKRRDFVDKPAIVADKKKAASRGDVGDGSSTSPDEEPATNAAAAADDRSAGSSMSPSSTSSRQLHSLLDYFPGLESSRRLTRTLTRRLKSSIVGGNGDASTSKNLADSSTSNQSIITGCGIGKSFPGIKSLPHCIRVQQSGSSVIAAKCTKKLSEPPTGPATRPKTRHHAKDHNSNLAAAANSSSTMDKQSLGLCSSTSPKEPLHSSSAKGPNGGSHRSNASNSFESKEFASSSNDSLDGNGRLHQLFETHRSSIPMHLFGALGPRMQTFLGRCQPNSHPSAGSSGGGPGARWDSLLTAMQKHDDTSAQLQGLIELCNLLVMSDEEILGTSFPVKEMVRCLIKLLQVEHSFDIMTHACRALTYLMDLWPRGVAIHVTDAVPYLLEKLQKVECIDVAEQALAALELLSRHHGKHILSANGISACLQFIDFFSTASQRSALQIVANCCLYMSGEDFSRLTESLPSLSQRLTSQDKKTVEILCQIFTRLVDNYAIEAPKLKQLCQHGMLENFLQLVVMSPPVLSSSTLCNVVRMLYLICRQCSEMAIRLLQLNIVAALRMLLIGTADPQSANSELLARTPQELQELVMLIGELWPALPCDGLFEVDDWLKSSSSFNEHILWTWKDEKGLWRPYMHVDNRILETAFQSKEEELTLSTMGQTFTVDLVNMIQINEDTGHSQPIQRRVAASSSSASSSSSSSASKKSGGRHASSNVQITAADCRLDLLGNQPKLYEEFIRCTFSVLYEIYTSVGGPAVRTECLRTLLRMIFHSESEMLKEVLKKHAISSLLAGILNSQDLKTVVPALQLSRILIEKQREIFVVHFKREGVTHQLQKLSSGAVHFNAPTQNMGHVTSSSSATPSYVIVGSSAGVGGSSAAGFSYINQQPQPVDQAYHEGAANAVYVGYQLPYYAAAAAAAAVAGAGQTPAASLGLAPPSAAAFGLTAGPFAPPVSQAPMLAPSFGVAGAIPKRPSAVHDGSSKGLSSAAKKRNSAPSVTSASGASSRHAFQPADKLKLSRGRGRAASSELANSSKATPPALISSAAHHAHLQYAASLAHHQQSSAAASSTSSSNFLTTGFLSNLAPRWVKSSSSRQNSAPSKNPVAANAQPPPLTAAPTTSASATLAQSVTSASFNTVKTVSWIKEQAKSIVNTYFSSPIGHKTENGEEILLNKLSNVADALKNGEANSVDELKSILSSDISCFEILQSKLIGSLTEYLTSEHLPSNISRSDRLRRACEIFFGAKIVVNEDGLPMVTLPVDQSLIKNFVQKLNTCASQLDQLPVKVHDFAFGGGSGGTMRGLNALRFLHTQQIKCLLQRHPDEKLLRQWRRGPIKVDPLAQISTIERYLVNRGYGRSKTNSNEELCSDGDNGTSDEDSDETTVRHVHLTDELDGLHRLQLSINNKILPADLSIYQAVRQFGTRLTTGDPLGGSTVDWLGPEIWVNTHTIFYRLLSDTVPADQATSDNKLKHSGAKNRAKDKAHLKPVLDPRDVELKPPADPLTPYLQANLPVECADPSFECLNLLRIFYGLSRYWWSTFKDTLISDFYLALSISDFFNAKIAGKISRQLQDPLMLIAGQIPPWIEQLVLACPFLCSFEIRMALFNVLALDRDRALQRLLDNFFDTGHVSSSERLTPRLERRKVVISRDDILRQAETVLVSMENSRAVLEVQYENEVGTGLGPTLEFYALVSKNLQRNNLQLWRGEVMKKSEWENDVFDEIVTNQRGLYPTPLGRHVKQGQLDKIKSKFKLIGKLLGRALLDGRILDLPLSPIFYKWLVKEESTLCTADLCDLDPALFKSTQYLLGQFYKSLSGSVGYAESKFTIESLELDFTLPGNSSVELIKGGKDSPVTLENVQQYVDLVLNWMLRAGVSRQMEIMREAFDSILPLKHLRLFMPEEMDQVFCGARSDLEFWDPAMLRQSIHPDHGYNHDSPQINWLVKILSEYDEHHRRLFLQFITGSPRLPVGGLKNLNPPFTAVRKQDGGTADSHLPSVMTCVNYLKLPEYSNKEIMAQRLLTAITCSFVAQRFNERMGELHVPCKKKLKKNF